MHFIMLTALYRKSAIFFLRPYIRREWPGWGILYRTFIGSFKRDWMWRGEHERWIRGKMHDYEMSVRIDGWSNRQTFFLERFYDLPTQLLLQKTLKKGDVFVDVGANEGMMTLLGSRMVGDNGLVISLEPNPTPNEICRLNIKRNNIFNVEIYNAGLGEKNETLSLFVPSVNTGEGSFTSPIENRPGKYVDCSVLVGDNVIGQRCPRLIKIDVEGYEGRVITGLCRTLETTRPIVCMEIVRDHLARDGETPEGLRDRLQSFGYHSYRLGLSPIKHLAFLPTANELQDGDYVFIHPTNPL